MPCNKTWLVTTCLVTPARMKDVPGMKNQWSGLRFERGTVGFLQLFVELQKHGLEQILGRKNSLWGRWALGTGCPEKLWHLWILEVSRARLDGAWNNLLQGCLPAQTIPWLCGIRKTTSELRVWISCQQPVQAAQTRCKILLGAFSPCIPLFQRSKIACLDESGFCKAYHISTENIMNCKGKENKDLKLQKTSGKE